MSHFRSQPFVTGIHIYTHTHTPQGLGLASKLAKVQNNTILCLTKVTNIIMVPTTIRFLITPLLCAEHCGPKIGFGRGGGGGGGVLTHPTGSFMKGGGLSFFFFYLLCLHLQVTVTLVTLTVLHIYISLKNIPPQQLIICFFFCFFFFFYTLTLSLT